MALSIILAAIRKLPYYYKNSSTLFERYKYNTYQFKNYTIGIIGYGRIGKNLFNDLKHLKLGPHQRLYGVGSGHELICLRSWAQPKGDGGKLLNRSNSKIWNLSMAILST